jgi:pSer/pThr/pTyr-binding forkhead associated (FHA) protein
MQVKLIVAHGKNAGQEVPVPGPKFFIGRAEDCDLRSQCDQVSRHHCALLVEDGFVAVRDFGSKNGTFVNDQRVKPEAELKSGDRLKVGPLEFEVQFAVEVAGKKLPKVRSVQEVAVRTAAPPRPKPVQTSEDANLSEWLDETVPVPAAAADTTPLDPTQTIAMSTSKTATPKPEEPAPGTDRSSVLADEEPVVEEAEPAQPQVVGTFSGARTTDAASSRDAASKGLKNLFRHFG